MASIEELLAALQNEQSVAAGADQDILSLLSQPLPQAQQVEAQNVRNPLNFGTALGAILQGPQNPAGDRLIQAQHAANAANAAAEQRAIEINATYKDRRDQREANRKMERERILAAADARVAQFETKIAEVRLGAAERAETRAARNRPKDPAEEAFKRYFEWSKTEDGQKYLLMVKPYLKSGKMSDGEGNRVAIPGTETGASPDAKSAALEVIGDMYEQAYGMVNAHRDFWAPDLIARELNELDAAYDSWKDKLVVEDTGGGTDKEEPPKTGGFLERADQRLREGLKIGGTSFETGLPTGIQTPPAVPLGDEQQAQAEALFRDAGLAIGAIDGAGDIESLRVIPEADQLTEEFLRTGRIVPPTGAPKRRLSVPFVPDGGAQ